MGITRYGTRNSIRRGAAAAATAASQAGFVMDSGQLKMTTVLNMDSNKIINLSNGSGSADGVAFGQVGGSGDAVATTDRSVISHSACTAGAQTQDIAIYAKSADEGIATVRVRWGSTRFNHPGDTLHVSVGFFPTGGSLDNDSLLLSRDIAESDAGGFVVEPYYGNWGAAWDLDSPYAAYGHRFNLSQLAHYQQAGNVYISLDIGSGTGGTGSSPHVVSDIDEGTLEVFLDLVSPE